MAADAALRERRELVGDRGVIPRGARRHQPAGACLQLVLEREEAGREQAVELVAGDGPRQGGLVEDLAGGARDAVIVQHHDARNERVASGPRDAPSWLFNACRAIAGIDAGAARWSWAVGLGRRNRPSRSPSRGRPNLRLSPSCARVLVLRAPCHDVSSPGCSAAQLRVAGHARGCRRRKTCAITEARAGQVPV